MSAAVPEAVPVIRKVIDTVYDRKRMSSGITACETRQPDFSSRLEMELAGVAMIPEARALMTGKLTEHWDEQTLAGLGFDQGLSKREVIIGAGYAAAVYCASRVAMGFPKPVVLERGTGNAVGGAFAMSLERVFRLNSRSRPGEAGLPDQDKGLNVIPGGLLQPSMISSEEYIDNADMAWLIRLTLAQYATVIPNVTVTSLAVLQATFDDLPRAVIGTSDDTQLSVGRAFDARGIGDPLAVTGPNGTPSEYVLNFPQLMARMGGMFPLKGMRQVAIRGGGNSGLCAAESLLGIAPGHTSAIGLDYVTRVDLYDGDSGDTGQTCSEIRTRERGRYVRLAQFAPGNVSQPTDRLRIYPERAYITPMPKGAIVAERMYDMVIDCTGYDRKTLGGQLSWGVVQAGYGGTVLATSTNPYPLYRIGVAADISFSNAEVNAKVAEIAQNKVAMFRQGPRIAGLAAYLPGL